MSLTVEKLFIYPVKSCGRLEVSQIQIGESGAQIQMGSQTFGDREWMFVDEEGKFLSQRTLSQMALIQPIIQDSKLFLQIQGKSFCISNSSNERRLVSVWGKEVDASLVESDVHQAASDFLKKTVSLVRFDQSSQREALIKGRGLGVQTRFTDSQPYLIVTEESLKDLNSKLKDPIGPERFRPNILLSGAPKAFAEDEFTFVGNEKVVFEGTKACARCKIITIDPDSGKIPNSDPLLQLSKYRKKETAVYFGQYFLSRSFGESVKLQEQFDFQSSQITG